MRITIAHVREIAESIQILTDNQLGRVQFGMAYDGRGTRVIDGSRQLVFNGRNSLRRAAAYYLGMYDRVGMREEAEISGKISEALYIVERSGLMGGHDYLRGVEDAASYLRRASRAA